MKKLLSLLINAPMFCEILEPINKNGLKRTIENL